MPPVPEAKIIVRGAREHNLKNVSVELPRDRLIVFTGLSGSGKSSLAFDTIYAEGQRRYVESLSAYARQFLGQMDKPDVDAIEGLSPAISIDQKSASRNPRSTVGTITEVYDYLRLLYARVGVQHCAADGTRLQRQTPSQIVDRILLLADGTRFQVLAPVVRGRKGEYSTLLEDLASQGFVRARIDGEVVDISEFLKRDEKLARYEQHRIEIVVDRLVRRDGIERRLTDSLETALKLADGVAEVELVGTDGEVQDETLTFSQHLACPKCGTSFEEPAPRNFSFNSPYGACEACLGLGTTFEVDPELLIPDPDMSINAGAIAPWRSSNTQYFTRMLEAVAHEYGFDLDAPYRSLTKAQQKIVMHGVDGNLKVKYKNRYGRTREYSTAYEGVVPWLNRRRESAESDWSREQYEGYMREVPCPKCAGARLKPSTLAVTVNDKNIAEVCAMSIAESSAFLAGLELGERDRLIAERVTKEINARLGFLLDVGLDYLSLSRAAGTLAGGEAQRIRLASQIGSGLVGTLYVLDEPSIGLHQRDNRRLIDTLLRLRDLGNTVLVVEHDEDTIREADWLVDIGPGAGEHGGEVIYSGPVKGVLKVKESITGQYLSGKRSVPVPQQRRAPGLQWLEINGAREHNLRNLDVKLPLGCFVAITGVSGSGKSTLVRDILLPVLMQRIYKSKTAAGKHKNIKGIEYLDKVIDMDQSPIGRTPRSNPATYIGVFDNIRKLFATTAEAKVRGYMPGRFSFNVAGGRCEACSGDGTIKIEMHFLPDVYVPCEVCKGARYNRDTLDIQFKGKNIAEVLDMPVAEAVDFFSNQPAIHRHMQTLMDVGLGYVRLGQSAPTLSGGEAQRVKLSAELAKRNTGHTIYLLDEPTTGLHFEDVRRLLTVLSRLVDQGNTVLVIEHNLDVIKTADWIIDLGPEGGSGGGKVVAQGSPEDVAKVKGSHTGRFLKPLLER
ncbi:MAG: excinuclease ABC subunit UvrA [Actinobacteria bacterium]|nr:excinuclease ABC subunit UvrA [Actinomycetota bacterium]MSW76453.1 excinuclease ABC subunit UvrA [Actinomycetota bacterium]MSX55931.1 excinuclease ABC subunit UvrA [Actinomycetota bacterium]MSZ82341.1 excinuclease ABC subunit UvrA [Actinomycetota bacterium]MTB16480.1 excinuclease ABC subunit UvrA [Actinomycetota bacterium]